MPTSPFQNNSINNMSRPLLQLTENSYSAIQQDRTVVKLIFEVLPIFCKIAFWQNCDKSISRSDKSVERFAAAIEVFH